MIIAFITLVAVISLIFWLVLPQFISAIMLVVDYIPKAVDWIVEQLEKLEYVPQDIIDMLVSIDWNSQIEKIAKAVTSGVGSVMGVVISTVSTVLGGIVTAFLSLIFAVYILLDKEKLGKQADKLAKKYLKQNWYEKLCYVFVTLDDCFRKYIVGRSGYPRRALYRWNVDSGPSLRNHDWCTGGFYSAYSSCRRVHRRRNRSVYDSYGKSDSGADFRCFPCGSPAA